MILKKKDPVKPLKTHTNHKWKKGTIIKFNLDEDAVLVLTDDGRSFWVDTDEIEKIE